MTNIKVDMLDAIKVQFLKPIFEDDFIERGMKAWLVAVEWESKTECYKLYFDFSDFEAENVKYFKESYYPNSRTADLPKKPFYTAIEAGQYTPKYSVYFSCGDHTNENPEAFEVEILGYLKEV